MFAFKKKYRPIRGQKWWEKIIDVISRAYPICQIEAVVCLLAFFWMLAVWGSYKTLEVKLSRPVTLAVVWSVLSLVFLWLVLCGIEWIGNCVERSVKKRVSGKIEQYITENESCSYDELISAVMKVRIHRGFDEALKEFEDERKFSVHGGICRIPTSEDKRRWHDEDVTINGVSFEELEQVFAHPLARYCGKLRIEFSVWEDEEHCLEKVQDAKMGAEIYVCTVAGGERYEFASFAELAAAPLFDGQNLREVCEKIAVSYANDFSWTPEFFEVNCT